MEKCKVKLKSGNVPDRFFNADQLRAGIKVEKEHTNSPCLAKQIAKAHLVEHKDYYKILKKVGL